MIRLTPGNYFGTVERAVLSGGTRITHSRHAASGRAPEHSHDRAYLCVVVGGAFTETCGTLSAQCAPGSVVWHPAGETHSDSFSAEGAVCVNVEVGPCWLARVSEAGVRVDRWSFARSGRASWLGALLREEATQSDAFSGVAVDGLLSALLATLERDSVGTARPHWVDRVVARLSDDFASVPTLDELAADAGVHRSHLARAFHRHVGCSIGEYVRRQRVAWACHQLSLPRCPPLSRLALAAGFADQAHFTRVFKRLTGSTPRYFRLLHRR